MKKTAGGLNHLMYPAGGVTFASVKPGPAHHIWGEEWPICKLGWMPMVISAGRGQQCM